MRTILYLIRHGETDWNLEGRWQGHADVPLNAIGRRQAELVAGRLREEGPRFDAIYSSDLSRAFQTAWTIGAALGVAVQLFPPLREIDLGTWSGLTRDDILERYPVEFALLEQGQDIPRGGAETRSALSKRVVEAVRALVAQHPGQTLALVGHGGSLKALLYSVADAAQQVALDAQHMGNTAISIITCDDDGWRIVGLNDMAHLEQPGQPAELASAPPDDAERPTYEF
jgi:probable phosphoglycerate mutase